jgi:hypothetical protein
VERASGSTTNVDGGRHAEMSNKLKMEEIEELAADVSAEELQEFLAADGLDVPFDPEFKERLREQLWSLVRNRPRSR